MPIRTFQYRLYPTKAQKKALQLQLHVSCHVYNTALQECKLAWQRQAKSIGKHEGYRLAKHYKKTVPQAKPVHSHVLQVAIEDLDRSFQAFFRRVKAGEAPGYPRFKSDKRWQSIGFKQYGNGFKIDGRRLKVSGVGRIRVRWHRPHQGEIKTCRVVHKAGRWYVSLMCEVPDPIPLPKTGRSVGIDMGINTLITLSEAHAELRRKQRQLQRAQKGSHQHQKKILEVQRQHDHVKNQRKDFFDKRVHELVHPYDVIVIEDLKIKHMVKNHPLNKSIVDAGWGYFKQRLLDKAAHAGREVVLVDPAYTTAASNIVKRVERVHERERSGMPQAWLRSPRL